MGKGREGKRGFIVFSLSENIFDEKFLGGKGQRHDLETLTGGKKFQLLRKCFLGEKSG